jgi:hypothetical protein
VTYGQNKDGRIVPYSVLESSTLLELSQILQIENYYCPEKLPNDSVFNLL